MKEYTTYCPECGCEDYTTNYEGMEKSHRVCVFCKQEYFSDIKYTVNFNDIIKQQKIELFNLNEQIEKMKSCDNCKHVWYEFGGEQTCELAWSIKKLCKRRYCEHGDNIDLWELSCKI